MEYLEEEECIRSEGPEQSQRHSEDVDQVLDHFKTVVQLQDLIMNEKTYFFHSRTFKIFLSTTRKS